MADELSVGARYNPPVPARGATTFRTTLSGTGSTSRLNGYAVAMGERDAAQAAVLIRALSDVRDKMISRMTWLERHGAQSEAAALRRDVNEAQAHITRLHRRYLGGDMQSAQPARQAR